MTSASIVLRPLLETCCNFVLGVPSLMGCLGRCGCCRCPVSSSQLQSFEMAKAVHLHPDPFTLENDLLTPTFKLKRNVAKARFQDVIDALYVKSGMGVVAGKAGLKQVRLRVPVSSPRPSPVCGNCAHARRSVAVLFTVVWMVPCAFVRVLSVLALRLVPAQALLPLPPRLWVQVQLLVAVLLRPPLHPRQPLLRPRRLQLSCPLSLLLLRLLR